jgi:hypothetical protein
MLKTPLDCGRSTSNPTSKRQLIAFVQRSTPTSKLRLIALSNDQTPPPNTGSLRPFTLQTPPNPFKNLSVPGIDRPELAEEAGRHPARAVLLLAEDLRNVLVVLGPAGPQVLHHLGGEALGCDNGALFRRKGSRFRIMGF